jgi:hypothetical protein
MAEDLLASWNSRWPTGVGRGQGVRCLLLKLFEARPLRLLAVGFTNGDGLSREDAEGDAEMAGRRAIE